jgi:hypothetical protein
MDIEVEDPEPREGTCVVMALVGNARDLFEVWLSSGTTRYYVNNHLVNAETYRLCLDTSNLDRYCPGCDAENDHEHEPEEVVPS